jgi:hypothetical protein
MSARAELIRQRREAAFAAAAAQEEEKRLAEEERRLAEERQRLEEEKAAAAGVLSVSTLDRSLLRGLQLVHDSAALKAMAGEEGDEKELMYDEEDTLDLDFWEHGINPPDPIPLQEVTGEEGKFKKGSATQMAKLFNRCREWENAFFQLETKFMRRALLVHDLRRVFDMKRKEIKALQAKAAEDKMMDVAPSTAPSSDSTSSPSTSSPSTSSSSSVKVTTKKCGCAKSKCGGNCGCKGKGLGCTASCDCGGPGHCLNISSYPDNDEGIKQLAQAQAERATQMRKAMEARRA